MPYEKKDNVWVSISLERNLVITELSRTLYTAFDFVSDVGGLSGFLFSFFTIITSVWNFNSFDNIMASQLYRFARAPHEPGTDKTLPILVSKSPNFKDYLRSCLPALCLNGKFCGHSRYDRALLRARVHLGQEIQIYNIVRLLRYFNEAMIELLPE